MSGYPLKPIPNDDVKYWWKVLEGKKLVKVEDYKFDPNVTMFTEENLPQPVEVLPYNKPRPGTDPGRYALWVNEHRVCVGLEAGDMALGNIPRQVEGQALA